MPCNTSETSSASSDSSSSRSQTSIPPDTSSSSSRSGDETGSSSSSTTASSSSGSESSSSSSSVTYPTPPPPGCPDGECECKCKCCDEKKSAPACPIGVTDDPVRYFNGEIRLSFQDLDSAGFGLPWGQTRSYTNQLPTDYEFGNGMNWINRQRPVLGEADGGNIFVILGFRDVRFFAPAGGDTYTPMYGSRDTLLYDSGTDIFTYITVGGEMWVFNGLDTPGRPRGQLVQYATAGGQPISLTYTGKQLTAASRTYDGVKVLRFVYTYIPSGQPNQGQLESIYLQNIASPDPAVDIKRVSYAYYVGDGHGSLGDLKSVIVQVLNSGVWKTEKANYFRYYVSNAGGIGFKHGLRFVVGTESYRRIVESGTIDPDMLNNAELSAFADKYFEYDPATRRVTKETVDAGARTSTLTYTERTSPPTEDYNVWQMKTVETLPTGGGVRTVYTNYAGGVMLRELVDPNDDSFKWIDYYQYDANGRLVMHAEPSAVIDYDDGDPDLDVTLRSSAGLIHEYVYYTTDTSPAALGYLQYEAVKEGTGGSANKLHELEYGTHTVGDITVRPVTKETVYRSEGNSDPVVTTYDYTYYNTMTPIDLQVKQLTTTLPAVTTAQNGSNTSDERWEYFDEFGNVTATKDERGYFVVQEYDPTTHALIKRVEDADSGLPSGWSPLGGSHLNLTTDITVDDTGRPTEVLGPVHTLDGDDVRTAMWTIYDDLVVNDDSNIAPGIYAEVRSTQGYLNLDDSTYYLTTPPAPVSIARIDGDGRTIAQIVSERDPGRTTVPLEASENYTDQSRWARCTVNVYDEQSQLSATQVYFLIPSSGTGSVGTNYDETTYGYDSMDRQNVLTSPAGTITQTQFEVRGLPVSIYVGTDATGATESDPTGGGGGGNNMKIVQFLEYDSGGGGGDGNLTLTFDFTDASNTRNTAYAYDYRDRQTHIYNQIDFYQQSSYDNLDRIYQVDRKKLSGSTLIGRSTTAFDNRGRVYQTTQYAVDPSSGSVGNSLVDNMWYDGTGNLIKSLPSGSELFTKTAYDGVGRAIGQYQGYYSDTGTEPYSEVGEITSDNVIFAQSLSTYDGDGSLIFVANYQRFHDATGAGVLNLAGGSQPKARVSYQAMWYDGIGRSIAAGDYGTAGNTTPPTRDDSPPASSSTVLVSSTDYNERGEADQATDPAGTVTETTYDQAGRVVETVQDPGGLGVTTQMTYHANGQIATLTAVNATTGAQVTTYTYGTTLTDSDIASNELLSEVEYPESSGPTDVVTYTYNRQNQRTSFTDQNGTVHEYVYDKLGRQTADCVTARGTSSGVLIDNAILRISRTYEVRGMVEKITSVDNATVGSGTVVNEVQRVYNDFGQLETEYQEHGGAVNTSTSLKVQYAYADGSANTIRPTQVTYPNGTTLDYDYGTSGDPNDRLSRVEKLTWNN